MGFVASVRRAASSLFVIQACNTVHLLQAVRDGGQDPFWDGSQDLQIALYKSDSETRITNFGKQVWEACSIANQGMPLGKLASP